MTLNYSIQALYLTKAVNVQQTITTAMTQPTGFLGVYILVIVISLYIWVHRIAEGGEWGKFLAWTVITSLLMYATFTAKTNITINLDQWEPDNSDFTAAYLQDKSKAVSVINSAPAIDSFFSVVTDYIDLAASTMINGLGAADSKVFAKNSSCASCDDVFADSFRQYINDIKLGVTVYGNDSTRAKFNVVQFVSKDLPQCKGYVHDANPATAMWSNQSAETSMSMTSNNPVCDDFLNRYLTRAKACIAGGDDPGGLLTDSLSNQFKQPALMNDMDRLSAAFKGSLLDGSGPLESGDFSVVARIMQFLDYGLTKMGSELLPELRKRTVTLMLIQVVCMGGIIAVSPFVVLYATMPIHGGVLNWKFLLKYLAAFGCVVAWYPLLLFLKAFLYGSFNN